MFDHRVEIGTLAVVFHHLQKLVSLENLIKGVTFLWSQPPTIF